LCQKKQRRSQLQPITIFGTSLLSSNLNISLSGIQLLKQNCRSAMGCGGSTAGTEPRKGGGAPSIAAGVGVATGQIVIEKNIENEISMGMETEFEPELLAE
jgi:hypothetical protein